MPDITAREAGGKRVTKVASVLRPSHVLLVTGARSWDDEVRMRASFRDAWRAWGPSKVTRPLLLSGHCPADPDGRSADAMAERLWEAEGFRVLPFPADWTAHGRRAGFVRNQDMVDLAVNLHEQGSIVRCTAYLDLCSKPDCPRDDDEQLRPRLPGHFSHGTVHCRGAAIRAGLETIDIINPSLAPALSLTPEREGQRPTPLQNSSGA